MYGKLVMIKKTKKTYSIIESRQHGKKFAYKLQKKTIIEKQRPPIVTLPEYRKKFKRPKVWIST